MTTPSLNISVVDKRMFNQAEAASYTGLSIKFFRGICDIQPVKIGPKITLWDRRDLDAWIDTMKEGAELTSKDAILNKL